MDTSAINHIGKVVFDNVLKQFAVLLDVRNAKGGAVCILEYADNQTRERSINDVELNPIRFCLVVG